MCPHVLWYVHGAHKAFATDRVTASMLAAQEELNLAYIYRTTYTLNNVLLNLFFLQFATNGENLTLLRLLLRSIRDVKTRFGDLHVV